MRVISCLYDEHDLLVVLLAALICMVGCLVSMRLMRRAEECAGWSRASWIFLTSVSMGSAIWATHFVAMLGYEPSAPVTLDAGLTALSAVIILAGSALSAAFAAAGSLQARLFGGSLLGLAIAAMHFVGMFAYRVDGLVTWDTAYIAAAIAISVLGSAAAFDLFGRWRKGWRSFAPAGVLLLAVVGLHFTGMAAFQVIPMSDAGGAMAEGAFNAMAFAVTVASLIVVGAGAAGYVIESAVRDRADNALRHMALHDTVTSLPNRARFTGYLDQRLRRADAARPFAVVMIDLNRFKEINDVWGHQAGDAVLIDIAERMRGYADADMVAARLGGDEFGFLLDVADRDGLHQRLIEIERLFQAPVRHADFEIVTGASLGVAIWPDHGGDRETLLRNADLAMYKAKTDALNRICVYEDELGEAVRRRRDLTNDLREALANDWLELHYQPQVDAGTGDTTGYEALIRWTHKYRGSIPPGEFIPLAEANGLIGKLGDFVLRRACREAVNWPEPHRVAINLSAVQLNDPKLEKKFITALLESGLPAERLEIELTETALIHDLQQSLHVLRRIKALGVSLALDDFGTGYSSLETLRRFPFDKIKLDKSFVDGLSDGGRTQAVIGAVVTLARSLSVPILAEGVETEDQLGQLRQEGCDQIQGFLIGRPAALVNGAPATPLRPKAGPVVKPEAARREAG